MARARQLNPSTSVVKEDLNPRWEATFEYDVTDPTIVLQVYVWHRRSALPDKFLGRVHVPVSTLEHRALQVSWHVAGGRVFHVLLGDF